MSGTKKIYSNEFKVKFIEDFEKSNLSMHAFCELREVAYTTAISWRREIKGPMKPDRRRSGPYTPEQRKQAIEAYLKSGMSQSDFGKTWGIGGSTLSYRIHKYEKDGAKGLEKYVTPKKDDKRKGRNKMRFQYTCP